MNKDNYYIRHSANIYYLDLVNEGLIGPIWYKIEPITWYVDMSNKLLISKNLITSNTNYTTFTITGNISVSGNLNSLWNYESSIVFILFYV